jgi:hypothetical protein
LGYFKEFDEGFNKMGCCSSHPVNSLSSASKLSEKYFNKPENLKIISSFDDSSFLSIIKIPKKDHSLSNARNSISLSLDESEILLQLPHKSTPTNPKKLNFLSNSLKCEKNHKMFWSSKILNSFDSPSLPLNNCFQCQVQSADSSWSCESCQVTLCESCGDLKGESAPHLRCPEGHILFWSPQTVWLYHRPQEPAVFACDNCEKVKHEPSWHCPECEFDLCLTCGESFNLKPLQEGLSCSEGHHRLGYVKLEVDISESQAFGIECFSCAEWIEPGDMLFQCDKHFLDYCLECFDHLLKKMIPHPGFRCKDWKKLQVFEKKKVCDEICDEIACDVCKGIMFEFCYLCDECFLCFCMPCAQVFHRKIKSFHQMKCMLGHTVQFFKPTDEGFECGKCKGLFMTGSFGCLECDEKICVFCLR